MVLQPIASEIEAITDEKAGVALLSLDGQAVLLNFGNGVLNDTDLEQYLHIASGAAKLLVQGQPCYEIQHQDADYMIYGQFTADQTECLIVKLKKRFDSLQTCREVLRQFTVASLA